jgi:hypothetical protein
VAIGFFQQVLDFNRFFGSFEQFAESLISQLTRDALEGTEVVAGPVGRRDKQKEQLHRITVETLEANSLGAHGNRAHEAINTGVFCVGHSHAPTDAGAAKILSLQDRFDDALEVTGGDLAGIHECPRHLSDHTLLGVSIDMRTDGVWGDEIGKLHTGSSFGRGKVGGDG